MNGWAILNAKMTKFHYVGMTKDSAAKWLQFRLANQARGEKYIGPIEIRVITQSDDDPPISVPRSDMTGEQLLAAYNHED